MVGLLGVRVIQAASNGSFAAGVGTLPCHGPLLASWERDGGGVNAGCPNASVVPFTPAGGGTKGSGTAPLTLCCAGGAYGADG